MGRLLTSCMLLLAVSAPAVLAEDDTPISHQRIRSLVLYGAASPPPVPPPHVGFDKVQHFTFSFLWTVGTQYTLVAKAELSEADALPLSVASAAVVGVAKEVYDWRREGGTGFSRGDLLADGLGIAAAIGLILL